MDICIIRGDSFFFALEGKFQITLLTFQRRHLRIKPGQRLTLLIKLMLMQADKCGEVSHYFFTPRICASCA